MDILLKAIPIAIPVILVILIFLMGYVKAPPDVAYIISGLQRYSSVKPASRSPSWSGWIS